MSEAGSDDGGRDTSSVLERLLIDSFDGSAQGSPAKVSRSAAHTPKGANAARGSTPVLNTSSKSPEIPRGQKLHENSPPGFDAPPPLFDAPFNPDEIAEFDTLITTATHTMRDAAFHAFDTAKHRIVSELTARMEAQRMHLEANVESLSSQLNTLKEKYADSESKNLKRSRQVNGLVTIVSKARIALLAHFRMQAAFKHWHLWLTLHRASLVKKRMARRMHVRRLSSAVVLAWRLRSQATAVNRRILACKAEAETVTEEALKSAAGEREALAKENVFLRENLRLEKEAKNEIYENLKRVFMRGVSALNFEAMTVLGGDDSLLQMPSSVQAPSVLDPIPTPQTPPNAHLPPNTLTLPYVSYQPTSQNKSFSEQAPSPTRKWQRPAPGTVVGKK